MFDGAVQVKRVVSLSLDLVTTRQNPSSLRIPGVSQGLKAGAYTCSWLPIPITPELQDETEQKSRSTQARAVDTDESSVELIAGCQESDTLLCESSLFSSADDSVSPKLSVSKVHSALLHGHKVLSQVTTQESKAAVVEREQDRSISKSRETSKGAGCRLWHHMWRVRL